MLLMRQRHNPIMMMIIVVITILINYAAPSSAARDYTARGPYATSIMSNEQFDGHSIVTIQPSSNDESWPVSLFVLGVTMPCIGKGGYKDTMRHIASHGVKVVCTTAGRNVFPDSDAEDFLKWFEHVEKLASFIQPSSDAANNKLSCAGHSVGAGMCHALAAYRAKRHAQGADKYKKSIDAIVLMGPVCGSLTDCCYAGGESTNEFLPEQGFACSGTFEPTALTTDDFKALQIPMLVISGNSDQITPQELANAIYDSQKQAPSILLQVRGGTHCFSDPYTTPSYDKDNPHCGCVFPNIQVGCACSMVSECISRNRLRGAHKDLLETTREAASAFLHLYLYRKAATAKNAGNGPAKSVWKLKGSSGFTTEGNARSFRRSVIGATANSDLWKCTQKRRRARAKVNIRVSAEGVFEARGFFDRIQGIDYSALIPDSATGEMIGMETAPFIPENEYTTSTRRRNAPVMAEGVSLLPDGWFRTATTNVLRWMTSEDEEEMFDDRMGDMADVGVSSKPVDIKVTLDKPASKRKISRTVTVDAGDDTGEKNIRMTTRVRSRNRCLRDNDVEGYAVNMNDGGTVVYLGGQ